MHFTLTAAASRPDGSGSSWTKRTMGKLALLCVISALQLLDACVLTAARNIPPESL